MRYTISEESIPANTLNNRTRARKPYTRLADMFLTLWVNDNCPACDENILIIMFQLASYNKKVESFNKYKILNPHNLYMIKELKYTF